ncbi:MAG: pre-peptidase C-terminal domain-containing protein [Deltaproteobacteria bacterium]|nr:pre-peptidase C-terminal domain-containing protein [Deltaproteobacteria bacterium]
MGEERSLACGVSFSNALTPNAVDEYEFEVPVGAAGLVQSAAVSTQLGKVRLRVVDDDGQTVVDTCTGLAFFTARPGSMRLLVSQCPPGTTGGVYTVTQNVISDGAGNCAQPLSCGGTPDGTAFDTPGEVDSYSVAVSAGTPVTLSTNYTQASGQPRLRLFDPDGQGFADQCSGTVQFTAPKSGVYTVLASACAGTPTGPYRIVLAEPNCPAGPVITTFGVANAQNEPQRPIGVDAFNRPIFSESFGLNFSLIIEGRAGANRVNPGPYPVPYGDENADMQMIMSRPLGDGSPVVCDISPPNIGGVPATVPFAFSNGDAPQDVVHDMGCRFRDGMGDFLARTTDMEACTVSDRGFGFGFVDRGSRLQFCGVIASAWSFPPGDTVVAARMKDAREQTFGAVREIVIRVGDPNPPTSTPTPSFTPTPSRSPTSTPTRSRTFTPTATPTQPTIRVTPTDTRTRTPTKTRTATPTAGTPTATTTGTPATPTATGTPVTCVGDCNGDGEVTIAEITTVLNIALGNLPLDDCPAADGDGSGSVDIADVIAAVNNALNGCSQ